MAQISFKNVIKRYGQNTIVHGIELEINRGEFTVLLGPSGCGKTTTLRMIAGLEDITEGDLSINGKRMNDVPPKNRKIAMVFQNYALYPHMTVMQNMEFALKPQKSGKQETRNKINDVSEMLALSPYLQRKPAQLSGGQRQRVAMGRAMVRTPEVFLFDEPLSNLDAKLRSKVRLEIAKLHKQLQTTIVYVTHDQVEAMTLADKIVVMKDGSIEQIGTPKEIFSKPNNMFVATFIGSPSMNMIRAKILKKQDAVWAVFGDSHLVLPTKYSALLEDGKDITIGIRANYIHPVKEEKENSFEAKIIVSEYLGAEILVDLNIGNTEVIAQISPDKLPDSESFRVELDSDNFHVFDTDSGRIIIP